MRKVTVSSASGSAAAGKRQDSLSSDGISANMGGAGLGDDSQSAGTVPTLNRYGSIRGGLGKMAKAHRSAENLNASTSGAGAGTTTRIGLPHRNSSGKGHGAVEGLRHASSGSSTSLPRVAAAATSNLNTNGMGSAKIRRDRAGSVEVEATTNIFSSLTVSGSGTSVGAIGVDSRRAFGASVDTIGLNPPHIRIQPTSPTSPVSSTSYHLTTTDTPVPDSPLSVSSTSSAHSLPNPSTSSSSSKTKHRRAPPLPPTTKRRKPPAVPGRDSPSAVASVSPVIGSGLRQTLPYISLAAASSQPSLAAPGARKGTQY